MVEPIGFNTYWKALPVDERRRIASSAGTTDEYINKYLLTHKRKPSVSLVRRIYGALPPGKGGYTIDDLTLFFFRPKAGA